MEPMKGKAKLILALRKEPEETKEKDEGPSDELIAAEEFLAAVKDSDPAAIVESFKALSAICSGHDPGDESDSY